MNGKNYFTLKGNYGPKCEIILDYLEAHTFISVEEAWNNFKCHNLSTIISKLRNIYGHVINTHTGEDGLAVYEYIEHDPDGRYFELRRTNQKLQIIEILRLLAIEYGINCHYSLNNIISVGGFLRFVKNLSELENRFPMTPEKKRTIEIMLKISNNSAHLFYKSAVEKAA